jgi:lysophospholipase L1-like esterase
MKLLTFALALGLPCLLQAQPAAPAVENTAIIPTGKLENDFYDWNKRHAEILAIKDGINPEIVLIGDSITHLWGGLPEEPKGNRGAASWKELFGDKRVLNCGFGWDRTQNVLFRIANGELDGLKPRTVVIHIGTNNLAGTKNARKNSPEEIASAITLIAGKVHEKCPAAKVILMAVKGGIRDLPWLTYLDITNEFLNADGTISREVMGDFLHPAEKGYAVWASALKPHVR